MLCLPNKLANAVMGCREFFIGRLNSKKAIPSRQKEIWNQVELLQLNLKSDMHSKFTFPLGFLRNQSEY